MDSLNVLLELNFWIGLFLIKQAGIVHAGGGWTCYLI